MSALLQQLLGFFRRHPFVIICSALSILLWVANYFIWQRHQELAASHQTLQRNGEAVARVIERPLAPGGPTVVLVAAPPEAFEQAPQLYAPIVADAMFAQAKKLTAAVAHVISKIP